MASNLVTFLARVTDGMLLVETMDNSESLRDHKRKAKDIVRQLTSRSPAKCTISAGPWLYHYVIEEGVVYMTLADKGYPKKLAYQYLEELQREFKRAHGADVATFSRPYAAVSFGACVWSCCVRLFVSIRASDC